jgi:hypothetical protein
MTTEDIQDEIERTRGEMATTLSAIERKLSPRQIMDQAVDTMRELASDQSRVGAIVRDNPIPLALIGLGIGWLAIAGTMSRRQGETESGSYESMEGVGRSWGGSADMGASGGATYGYAAGTEAAADAESAAYGTAGAAEYAAGGNGQGVRDKAGRLAQEASERASRATQGARQRVNQWTRSARSSASQAADRTWENYQQHPLTMGLVAMMAGAALGAMLPTSRREQEFMGGAAEDLVSRARETGAEVMDKAARVADRAVQAAKDETRQSLGEEKEGAKLAGSPSTMTH